MKNKFLLLIILAIMCINIYATEIATFNQNAEKFKTFNGLKLDDFKVGRVNDKSKEVYFTNDKFGIGITNGGEFSLNINDKRLTLAGLSGIIAYDAENPTKLYRFNTKKITKENFTTECKELGLSMTTKVVRTEKAIEFENELIGDSDRKIVLAFCLPMDGTTTLLKDNIIWVEDFSNAYNTDTEETDTFAYEAPNDKSISRYPLGCMLNGFISIAMATSPLSRDSKFVYYKSLKSFANQYELTIKKDTPVNLDFLVFRTLYEWGFRGAYEKYTELHPGSFPNKSKIKATEIKELDGTDYYFKSLLTFDGFKIKGPLELKDIYFLKCAAKNKPVYYEIPNENFDKEYAKAVFFGFIPVTDNISKPIVNNLKETFNIIQQSAWQVIPQSESKNYTVITERYKDKDSTYVVAYNITDIRRVTFVILYEYNGENKITNIVDKSEYNIKNKSIDIIINPYNLAMFKY